MSSLKGGYWSVVAIVNTLDKTEDERYEETTCCTTRLKVVKAENTTVCLVVKVPAPRQCGVNPLKEMLSFNNQTTPFQVHTHTPYTSLSNTSTTPGR